MGRFPRLFLFNLFLLPFRGRVQLRQEYPRRAGEVG